MRSGGVVVQFRAEPCVVEFEVEDECDSGEVRPLSSSSPIRRSRSRSSEL